MKRTIYQEDCARLRAKLRRVEKNEMAGKGRVHYISVDVDTLDLLLEDAADLEKIRRKEA